MNRFAALLDRLAHVSNQTDKLTLINDYFGSVSDTDRGYALAAMTGGLDFRYAKPTLVRGLAEERMDPVLFELSHDYVGDLAETVSLLWPARHGINRNPPLSEIVETLGTTSKSDLPGRIAGWMDALDANGRWALLKLVTGGLRTGVSARLAKTALAQYGDLELDEVEEIWHGIEPPYEALFAWADGTGPRPEPNMAALFRPLMPAQPVEGPDLRSLDPADFRAEWTLDGARVLAAASGGERRLYSHTGDDLTRIFPDLIEAMDFDATIEGTLLVIRDGKIAPFSALERRLGRKTVSKKLLAEFPVAIRAHDLLFENGEDLRGLPYDARRARLERCATEHDHPRIGISPLLEFESFVDLNRIRYNPRYRAVTGIDLKRRSGVYRAGSPEGNWYAWKCDPYLVDAVLLYGERGQGKQSSVYVDYTFGVWRDGELVPIGKAPFVGADADLQRIDGFIRDNTADSFGPVREVTRSPDHGIVFEIAFDGISHATRRRSGLALRAPRINRLKWDKPPREADQISVLESLLPD